MQTCVHEAQVSDILPVYLLLYRALKACLEVDEDCVQAFMASISNRLYRAEMSDR